MSFINNLHCQLGISTLAICRDGQWPNIVLDFINRIEHEGPRYAAFTLDDKMPVEVDPYLRSPADILPATVPEGSIVIVPGVWETNICRRDNLSKSDWLADYAEYSRTWAREKRAAVVTQLIRDADPRIDRDFRSLFEHRYIEFDNLVDGINGSIYVFMEDPAKFEEPYEA